MRTYLKAFIKLGFYLPLLEPTKNFTSKFKEDSYSAKSFPSEDFD